MSIFDIILVAIVVMLLLDRNAPRRGGGYTPRPPPPGIHRIPTPPRPAGMPPFPGPYYILKGLRFPWDIRPRWLWEDQWKVEDLPYGVAWADKIKANIAEADARRKRPAPPAPMRPKKP